MKTKLITFLVTYLTLTLIASPLFSQEMIPQVELPTLPINNSPFQTWSMELRANYDLQTFIDNRYIVKTPDNISCHFAIAYEHGQNYYTTGALTYYFLYALFKNGVEISSHTVRVPDSEINKYIVYYKFTDGVIVGPNDVITGGLKIIYYYPVPGNPPQAVLVLPATASPYYQVTPNSIQFMFNKVDVVLNNLIQPKCKNIMPTNYYDVVQATNSITLGPGFNVNSIDKNFSAEIINLYNNKSKNIINSQEEHQNLTYKLKSNTNTTELKQFILIYPNPSDGRFIIKNIYTKELTLSFYNQNGKIIQNKKIKPGKELNVVIPRISSQITIVAASLGKKVVSKQIAIVNK